MDRIQRAAMNPTLRAQTRRFNIKVNAKLGITFDYDYKITTSILKSGITIVEGFRKKEEALDLFRNINACGVDTRNHSI